MNLKEIISITGKTGLFKVVAQGKNKFIVESIVDRRRFPAHASDRISTLGDISIYTTDGDVKLIEVFEKFNEKYEGGPCPSHKEDLSKLKDLLREIVPDYDDDRVYTSDLKKIFQWYNILITAGISITGESSDDSGDEEGQKSEVKASGKHVSAAKGPGSAKSAKPSSAKTSGPTKTGSQRGN